MSASQSSDGESISLEEALQRCDGRGAHARRVLLAASAACTCGGMAGAVAPFLMTTIPIEGDYEPWATSMLASSMFAGMWAGSVLGGIACDALGPGRVMLASLVLLCAAGFMPVALPSLAITARVLCGVAICAVYQAANTYVAEWVVTSRRSTYLSALHVFIACGGVATTLLAVYLQAREASWRTLLAINSTPPLLVLALTYRFVSAAEAPRWLLVSGPPGKCERVMRRIALSGGSLIMRTGDGADDQATLPPIALQLEGANSAVATARAPTACAAAPRRFSVRARCTEMLSLWRLHAFGCALSFCLNFGSKGSEIWVGAFVERKGLAEFSRVIYLCTMLGKISGDILNMAASRRLGRLRCLQAGFVVCALSTLGFVLPVPQSVAGGWLLGLAYVQGAGMDLLWCNLYIYLVERFPTTVRSTGFGVASEGTPRLEHLRPALAASELSQPRSTRACSYSGHRPQWRHRLERDGQSGQGRRTAPHGPRIRAVCRELRRRCRNRAATRPRDLATQPGRCARY